MPNTKKSSAETRTKEIKIRVTESEFDELKKKSGNNMAAYLRENSLSAPPKKIEKKKLTYPTIDPNFTRQLSYIGNNLNQLTRTLHLDVRLKRTLNLALITLEIDALKNAVNELNDSVKNWSKHDS